MSRGTRRDSLTTYQGGSRGEQFRVMLGTIQGGAVSSCAGDNPGGTVGFERKLK